MRSAKTAAVEWQISDGAFVEQGGDGAGLGLNQHGSAGNRDVLLSACDGETEFDLSGGADVDVKLGE